MRLAAGAQLHRRAKADDRRCSALKGGETGDPNAEVTLDFTLADHQRLAPSEALQMTEWGQSAADGAVAANASITSEAAMSKYVSRGLLENYLRGVREDVDLCASAQHDRHQIRHGRSGRHRAVDAIQDAPLYTTIQRLIAIMADPGGSFTTDTLDYAFTGTGADGLLHHRLFQKRSGLFYLMVTHDGVSWKRSAPVGDMDPAVSVNLVFSDGAKSLVRTWTPHISASATTVGAATSSVALVVPDHLMIVEITP